MRWITLFVFCSTLALASGDEWTPLFPDGAPLGVKTGLIEEAHKERNGYPDGGIRHITEPGYKVMLPDADKRTGAAVVIFPGGGYAMLAMGHEGYDYAKWLVERGVVAVVVKYRVSTDARANDDFPVPLLDARRAIRTTRAKAAEWGIDPDRIGVMGSSAGGHLASMCATMAKEEVGPPPSDDIDRLSCAVNFAILVYPVIGMDADWGHRGSRHNLIGKEAPDALAKQVATYRRVDADTPPCFLVHAADDRAVPLRNSMEFAARCAEHKVSVVCHVYAHGGHGFGLKGKGDSQQWAKRLEEWLVFQGLATASGSK
ncbi:MAG: alpha/beta hydrolase [Akkermansiaceae bacterium]|nr:alpha/beta hydrolase [Akkermansiaceae bacterium]